MKSIAIIFFCFGLWQCNSSHSRLSIDNTLSQEEEETGWELLFDGNTTKGWHTYGKDYIGKAWKADSGTLHLDPRVKDGWQTKDGGDIVTDKEFDNFHLKLEWKISEGENSGIFFYVNEDTSKYKYPWQSGLEMQVCDNEKNEDGNVDKARAGDIYDFFATTSQQFVKPAMQWNKVEIIANNGSLELFMNGQRVLSETLWDERWKNLVANSHFKDFPGFGMYKKGRIGMQDHGADVWFRNIKIKRL